MSQGLFRSVREYGGNETQDAEVDVDGSFQTFKQLGIDRVVFGSASGQEGHIQYQ